MNSIQWRIGSVLHFFASSTVAITVRAALPDEIQVYTNDLEKPGEFGMELHINTTLKGRATPDYAGEVVPHHGLRITPEFSRGLAEGWDGGIYLPFVRSAEGTANFAGPRLRFDRAGDRTRCFSCSTRNGSTSASGAGSAAPRNAGR